MIEPARLPEDVAAALRTADPGNAGLIGLLHESAPLYVGRSSSEVERLRAQVMVSLLNAGFADELVPYAIEQFETGTDAHAIAAAARVVRAAGSLPSDIGPLIVRALERVSRRNEFIRFDGESCCVQHQPISAVDEVTAAVADLGVSCCSSGRDEPLPTGMTAAVPQTTGACCTPGMAGETGADHPEIVGTVAGLGEIELQNQDGLPVRFDQLFALRMGLVAFFYTRCMIPEKCSRTVSQLGEVTRLIRGTAAEGSTTIAGITYDPAYDLPGRLRRYGEDRGLAFGGDCQLLRTTGPFDAIRDRLQLGVGYGASTVNRHRIELLLIHPSGDIVLAHARRLWDAQEMATQLLAMHGSGRKPALPR